MSKADEPAFPCDGPNVPAYGLTIREHFAAMAMQGLQAQFTHEDGYEPSNLARHAVIVIQADALIAELEKQS